MIFQAGHGQKNLLTVYNNFRTPFLDGLSKSEILWNPMTSSFEALNRGSLEWGLTFHIKYVV
jgi:hypothetical protein